MIPRTVRVCVEVRHRGWFAGAMRPRLNALLSKHNAARVIIDTRGVRAGGDNGAAVRYYRTQKPNLPIQPDLTADFAFLRLITHPQAELNEPVFAEWTRRIADWLAAGTSAYVFAHCPDDTQSPIFARGLHARIAALTPVDPLAADPVQGTLL